MTIKELKAELDKMHIAYRAKATKAELENLYNESKESENKAMTNESNFETLKSLLATIEECYIINETERRLTTNKVMFCKRANNKVRAYLKLKTDDSLATEKNTQYKANVLIDLNDSYAIYTLRRLYAR